MKDQKYLHECFSYDELTGDLTWKDRPESHFKSKAPYSLFKKRIQGNVAGNLHKSKDWSYIRLKICGDEVSAHRVIWCMVHGSVDGVTIDHINGDSTDNRIINLRSVTASENQRNQKINKRNTTGITGVYKNINGSYSVRIVTTIGGRSKGFGSFYDIELAELVAKEVRSFYGYHDNHGRSRN